MNFTCFLCRESKPWIHELKNCSLTSVIINQYAVLLYAYPLLTHLCLPLFQSLPCFLQCPMEQHKSIVYLPLYMEGFPPKQPYQYVQNGHPELPATSAALCLIISITAALRRESDCCCSLLKCSFRSLDRKHTFTQIIHD